MAKTTSSKVQNISRRAAASGGKRAAVKAALMTSPFKAPDMKRTLDGQDMVNEVVRYRGNVPLRSFVGWLLLVLLGVGAVGLLTTQLLVSQRQNQLIEETAARVDLQGQSRARLVGEWLQGLMGTADSLASAQVLRLYVTEAGQGPVAGVDAQLRGALSAQKPYMAQALADFVRQNHLEGAHVLTVGGDVLLSQGPVPEGMAVNRAVLDKAVRTQSGVVLPLRLGRDSVVMDVVRPIFEVGEAGPGEGKVVGALWFTLPAGDKLADLLATTPLDRPGERTALIQQGDPADTTGAMVVGRTALAPLGTAFEDFRQSLASGRALSLSAVDGKATFATLMPVNNTPFHVLQEYRAGEALALMNLYKPGLYLIVGLGVVVLAAFMLAMTVHLMAQRNRTRVKLLGQTMEALVRAVEARDPHLAGHHARVARLAIAVANRLNLPVGERATLFYAAQMAAVGRLLVPRDILSKTGKLSPDERKMMEVEIAKSHGILADLDFDLPIVAVIGQMYERADGSGYPEGLKGDQISRMARVLGAVDAYVAMTADRSYRKALTPSAAQKAMLENGKFDASVVAALKGLK